MNSNTSIILVVVCVACMCLLVCGGGIAFLLIKYGSVENAFSALTGNGGSEGSGWKWTERTCTADGGKDGVKNSSGQCVPLEVESQRFGGEGGKVKKYHECPDGQFITGLAVGYDDTPNELKWVAGMCRDGTAWSEGLNRPSTDKFPKSDGAGKFDGKGYDNRYWVNPASPGWDQVTYVTRIRENKSAKAKGDDRVRAFGPKAGTNGRELFGVTENRGKTQLDILEEDKKVWRCDEAGYAPSGKRYAIVGVHTATGNAVDSLKFKCRMFDTA